MEAKTVVLGRNPVFEYIRHSGTGRGHVLYISKNAHGRIVDSIIREAKGKKIPIEYRDREFFAEQGPSSSHQGIMLIVPAAAAADDRDILSAVSEKKGVLVLLDRITDPRNTGSIIRSVEALGGDGVVIPKNNSAQVNETVIKASAGATAHLPVISISNVAGFMDRSKKAGFWIIGTSDRGDRDIRELGSIRPALLVIGSEGEGMRNLTHDKCDFTVRIPLKGRISSLNASVAAGILLYELLK